MKKLKQQEYWPDHVMVIGSGRWARVIVQEICNIIPSFVDLSVHSRGHIASMEAWVNSLPFNRKIHLSSGWPPPSLQSKRGVAIIANAAKDHPLAVKWALENCSAVLVEKPMASSKAVVQSLIDLSKEKKTFLAPAHVFLFARYIEKFAHLISEAGTITSLHVDWTDPESEVRHGEKKRYDSAVPVYADWLPHIAPLIGVLTGEIPQTYERLQVSRGGARVIINLKIKNISCCINMERNASQRRRIIQVIADEKRYELDFSKEPGVIRYENVSVIADERWGIDDRPLACMLKSFMRSSSGGEFDKRLELSTALYTYELVDKICKEYYLDLNQWVHLNLYSSEPDNIDMRYALTEILMNDHSIPFQNVEEVINGLNRYLKSNGSDIVDRELFYKGKASNFISKFITSLL